MPARPSTWVRGLSGLAAVAVLIAAAAVVAPVPSASATIGTCTPDPAYDKCAIITNAGLNNDQSWTVPAGVRSIGVKLWGAGGGGVNATYYTGQAGGASGGYTTGTVPVTPGSVLTVVVGQGGQYGALGTSPTYGGGGAGGGSGTAATGGNGSSGGGMSAIFLGAKTAANALFVAGGGGGASPGSDQPNPGSSLLVGSAAAAGAGGGTAGGQDLEPVISGRAGTSSAGGAAATGTTGCTGPATAGAQFSGGTGSTGGSFVGTGAIHEGGGGGGGGFFGGGGGKCQNTPGPPWTIDIQNGPGGGGSGFVSAAASGSTVAGNPGVYGTPGAGGAAPSTSEPQYTQGSGRNGVGGSVGFGQTFTGGDGLVVIQWRLPRIFISKVSVGGVGSFTFTGTNGYQNQTLTTTAAGTAVDAPPEALTAPGVATTISEGGTAGFQLTAISCTGLGTGGTATPNLASGAVALDAAAVAYDANIHCTFTNTAVAPNINITKAMGTVSGPDASGEYTATYQIKVANTGTASGTYGALTDTPGFSSNIVADGATWTTTGTSPATGSDATAPYALTTGSTTIAAGATHTYDVVVSFHFSNTNAPSACAGAGTGLYNAVAAASGENGTTTDNSTCDTPPSRYDVYLHKVGKNAAGATVSLSGSAWQLQTESAGAPGTVVSGGIQAVTGQTGEFKMPALPPGAYWLTETTAPTGYVLLAQPVRFVVSAAGAVTISSGGDTAISVGAYASGQPEITVGNPTPLILPLAGGSGSGTFVLVGGLLLAIALLVALLGRRRRPDPGTGKRVRK